MLPAASRAFGRRAGVLVRDGFAWKPIGATVFTTDLTHGGGFSVVRSGFCSGGDPTAPHGNGARSSEVPSTELPATKDGIATELRAKDCIATELPATKDGIATDPPIGPLQNPCRMECRRLAEASEKMADAKKKEEEACQREAVATKKEEEAFRSLEKLLWENKSIIQAIVKEAMENISSDGKRTDGVAMIGKDAGKTSSGGGRNGPEGDAGKTGSGGGPHGPEGSSGGEEPWYKRWQRKLNEYKKKYDDTPFLVKFVGSAGVLAAFLIVGLYHEENKELAGKAIFSVSGDRIVKFVKLPFEFYLEFVADVKKKLRQLEEEKKQQDNTGGGDGGTTSGGGGAVTGAGVTGDGATGDGVTGAGATGDGVTGAGATGDGVTGGDGGGGRI